jgi:hypothetical protein
MSWDLQWAASKGAMLPAAKLLFVERRPQQNARRLVASGQIDNQSQ